MESNQKQFLNALPNHQKIKVNLKFAVKFSWRHKARLVTDGSLTPDPGEIVFHGELNNLELWGADTGNAHLETYTHEKLFIIPGAEFEELEGIILFFNKALYGTESVAAKAATGKIMDLRYTLKYLRVPINSKSHMCGVNRFIVTNATLPHSTLCKGCNILPFHSIREAIAAKIIGIHWMQSNYNPSNFLSKHCEIIKIFNAHKVAHHL